MNILSGSLPMLAEISGSGMIHQIIVVLFVVCAALILWGLGVWLIKQFNAPAVVAKGWNVLFVILAALAAINFFLGLAHHPFIDW